MGVRQALAAFIGSLLISFAAVAAETRQSARSRCRGQSRRTSACRPSGWREAVPRSRRTSVAA
jgi:hypothetical protein